MSLDRAVQLLREVRPLLHKEWVDHQRVAKRIDEFVAAVTLQLSPDRCCPRCGSTRLVLDETTMLSSIPPQRPAECRDCGTRFTVPATGFLVAKPKAPPAEDETERLRERVKQLVNRDRDAIKWRDRWRDANAEGLRLREALTEIAVGDHDGQTPEERAQAALDGDEE
jgi:hypothetical protein